MEATRPPSRRQVNIVAAIQMCKIIRQTIYQEMYQNNRTTIIRKERRVKKHKN